MNANARYEILEFGSSSSSMVVVRYGHTVWMDEIALNGLSYHPNSFVGNG